MYVDRSSLSSGRLIGVDSIALYVWFRIGYGLSGLGLELGWIDDHPVVSRYGFRASWFGQGLITVRRNV